MLLFDPAIFDSAIFDVEARNYWAIFSGSTAVILTPYPNNYRFIGSAQIEGVGVDGGGLIGVSRFTHPETCILTGSFSGTSESTLYSTYITNLRALKGKAVSIINPTGTFQGEWLLKNYEFTRVEGKDGVFVKIDYTLTFELYTENVVLL